LRLSFHGAAGTVTGSRYLLEANDTRLQIDCGLFQGLKELRLRNWQAPPYDPRTVDHLLLTHSHVDHSAYLPKLVREGFAGPVHATPASIDLAQLILRDSAKLQEEDAFYANKKGFSKHKPALPLYTSEDAEVALKLFREVAYQEWIELPGRGQAKHNGIQACFHNMGHILGASSVELKIRNGATGNGTRTIVFSGDVGRYNGPLHAAPDPRADCDYLVVESTYGDRRHDETSILDQIREPFLRTLKRKGVVLIPAFAVGRSQVVTLILRELMNDKELPEVPIHIDSPMAVDATAIYSRHIYDCNLKEEVVQDGRSRLFPRKVHLHRTVSESKQLNKLPGPRVIISASGMMTGGRILHHLARRLPDAKNLILTAGYQAAGTRGRSMVQGAKSVKIHGEYVPIKAEFRQLNGLSAHADCDELMAWITSARTLPKKIFVTHGEPQVSQAFAARITAETGVPTHVPELGDEVKLD